jgi:hypothetical protein
MNSGKVQLDVVLRGKDEVTAVLAQVEKQARKTEKQLNDIGNASLNPNISGVTSVANALGNTVEAVDKTEERFNKLVGAIGFVGAAFAIVPVIYDFASELLNTESASDRAEQSIGRLSDVLIKANKDFQEFNKQRAATEGARRALEIEERIAEVSSAGAEVARERIELESQLGPIIAEQTKKQQELQSFLAQYVKLSAGAREALFQNDALDALIAKTIDGQKQIAFIQDRLNEAKSAEQRYAEEIANLESERLGFLRQSTVEIFKSIGLYDKVVNRLSALRGLFKGAGLMPEVETPTLPTGPRGKTAAEIGIERTNERIENDIRTADAMTRLDKKLADQEAAQAKLQKDISEREDMEENQALLEEEIRLFGEYTDSIYSAADAFDTLANSLGEAADLFPEIGDGFRGVQEAMQKHAEFVKANEEQVAQGFMTSAEAVAAGEESKTKAIISGSTEGLAAIGKLIGGLKAEYALRSAGELAMGFATLSNPVESAGHFVAAGLFAVAAGKAAASGGGSGAGAAGADSEAPATSSSLGYGDGGGQRTVVYNFSTLLADRQQVHRAIRDSELVGQRNGYGRRRGV